MRNATRLSLLLGSLTLATSSCGSSSDVVPTGDILGLSMPDSMELIGIDAEAVGSSVAAGATINPAVFADNSDYNTDEVNAYMWDETMQPLELINDILTAVGQTRADFFVNTGPYLALVQEVGGGNDGGDAGQSSSGNATELEPWVMNSTRASATAAQVVRFWIEEEDESSTGGDPAQTIFGRASVSEEPTATSPYGDFHLDFAMVDDTSGTLAQRGTLQTTDPAGSDLGFIFMMEALAPGAEDNEVRVSVLTNADQTSGSAHMEIPNEDTGLTVDLTLAYNSDYFLRSDGVESELLDRNDFVRNTWAYNLYYATDGAGHSAGDRLDIEGGFPFAYDNSGSTEYGWVDYWGIWSSDVESLTTGTTVTRDEDGSSASYTVLRAPGKLIRVTKSELPLAELDGATFEFWSHDEEMQFLLEYDHTAGLFYIIATREAGEDGSEWNDIPDPDVLTIDADIYYGFWSQTLGGSLDFVGGDTFMTIREQTFVSGDDAIFAGGTSLSLFSMADSLDSGMSAEDVNLGDIFMPEIVDPALAYEYTFLKNGRNLQFGGVDVGLLPGEVPSEGFYTWGMQSGPLTLEDPVTLGITDAFEMWGLDEYYVYETGANEWNQYSTLLTAVGAPVEFDTPISFLYTHTTANDADSIADFDGQQVFLTYGGERSLWGIPGVETDIDGDGFGDRWYPMFSIKDGVAMGPTGIEYVVKAVDMELYMQVSADPIPAELTTALTNAASLALPTMADWTDPSTVLLPVVTDEPAVVAGVIQ